MARTRVHDDEERRLSSELRAMERRYEGVVQQFRLDDLTRKLGTRGSMATAHSWNGLCGDRVTMWLDDGSVLKLSLFWPIRRSIAALRRVAWSPSIGWVVDVRTSDGDEHRLYAWRVRLLRPQA